MCDITEDILHLPCNFQSIKTNKLLAIPKRGARGRGRNGLFDTRVGAAERGRVGRRVLGLRSSRPESRALMLMLDASNKEEGGRGKVNERTIYV